MVLTVLTSLVSLAMLAAGLLAYLSNKKNITSRYFLYLSVSLAIWMPANYLGSNLVHPYITELLVNIDFSIAIFIMLFMLFFLDSFALAERRKALTRSKLFILSTIMLNLVFVPLIFMQLLFSVDISTGELSITTYSSFYLYVATVLLYMIYTFTNLYITYKKSEGNLRQTLNLVFTGFFVAATTNIITNIVIPEIVTRRSLVQQLNIIGYLGILVLVICIYVAISAKQLFDIRLVVARSLGYILSVGSLAIVYGLVAFTVIDTFIFNENTGKITQQITYTLLAVVLAFTFQPLKRFFDKFTNKLFYRDAYETQEFLNDFNQAIVTTIELTKLLDKASGVINKYMKPDFSAFALIDTSNSTIRLLHNSGTKLSNELMEQVRGYVKKGEKIINADLLDDDQHDLRSLMRQIDGALLVRITKSTNIEGIGYMVLGYKKTGSIYNSQDTAAIEIIANELAIATENALRYEEIQDFAKTLQAKVDDATRDLRKANEKLKALDQTKDDFISMASHQLRTPLTSVKGYVSMVLEGDAGKVSTKQKELLDQAFVSSQRMVYLIADLLNVSRLRTGKFVIEAKKTNLADVVEGEMAQLIETAKGKGLELTYHKPTKFPELMLDETKIRQVIMNFSDNAIHYTPSGGHVSVNLEDRGDTVEFTVVDDGLGVPKAEQHHLFNKFYRASNAKKARPDGTGLGLFMAKKVIIAQGGAIIFKTQEGKGSTFGFSFTKKPLLPEHYKGAVSANAESVTEKT